MKLLIQEKDYHKIGVYCIENIKTKKKYIGSTTASFKNRWQTYKNGGWYNKKLNNSIGKYGIENFTFEIVKIVEKHNVRKMEEFFILKYNTINNGYNIKLQGTGGNGGANKGKKYPKPSREIVERRAIGISRSMKGKAKSKNHCRAISEAKKGCKPSHSLDVILWDTIEECTLNYSSATEAAKKIGCSIQQVCSLVKGKSKLLKGRFTHPHRKVE